MKSLFNLINLFYKDGVSCINTLNLCQNESIVSAKYDYEVYKLLLSNFEDVFIKASGKFYIEIFNETSSVCVLNRVCSEELFECSTEFFLSVMREENEYIISIIALEKDISFYIFSPESKSIKELFKIQHFAFPSNGFSSQTKELFFSGKASLLKNVDNSVEYLLTPKSVINFFTYLNIFDYNKWLTKTNVKNLYLFFNIEGEAILRIKSIGDYGILTICSYKIDSPKKQSFVIPIDFSFELVGVEFDSVSCSKISDCAWCTDLNFTHISNKKLAIIVTAFNEPDALNNSKQIVSSLIRYCYLDSFKLFLIDNSSSLETVESEHLKVIHNKNLGGTGGFIRGFYESLKEGFDVCMFMDDDAFCSPFSIEKAYKFLICSNNTSLAISGAMGDKSNMLCQLELGAWFNKGCHPLNTNLDMLNSNTFIQNNKLFEKHIYGAWWFFMFNIKKSLKMPYPFFVRGDDIDFSYKNSFDIVTLNGVCSWQENFQVKESVVSIFLFIRSHIIHHLTLNIDNSDKEIRASIITIIYKHLLRFLKIYRYDYALATLLAFEFVLKGAKNWENNLLLGNYLSEIKNITNLYSPSIVKVESPCDFYKRLRLYPITRLVKKYTINSILLPTIFMSKKAWVIPKNNWVDPSFLFLKSQYYQEKDSGKFIKCKHSLLTTIEIFIKFYHLKRRFNKDFISLKSDYQVSYNKFLTIEDWRDIFQNS